jgi:hypothetical protein
MTRKSKSHCTFNGTTRIQANGHADSAQQTCGGNKEEGKNNNASRHHHHHGGINCVVSIYLLDLTRHARCRIARRVEAGGRHNPL